MRLEASRHSAWAEGKSWKVCKGIGSKLKAQSRTANHDTRLNAHNALNDLNEHNEPNHQNDSNDLDHLNDRNTQNHQIKQND